MFTGGAPPQISMELHPTKHRLDPLTKAKGPRVREADPRGAKWLHLSLKVYIFIKLFFKFAVEKIVKYIFIGSIMSSVALERTNGKQTYANTSYPSVDSIKLGVSAMHREQHNYDNH